MDPTKDISVNFSSVTYNDTYGSLMYIWVDVMIYKNFAKKWI
jgi:hypothetical protein